MLFYPVRFRGLRAQGAELLRQAADVNIEDRVHPAYTQTCSSWV